MHSGRSRLVFASAIYGPRLVAGLPLTWCAERGIEPLVHPAGKPDQGDSSNIQPHLSHCRSAQCYVQVTRTGAESPAEWLQSYNEERPHDALAACRRPRIGPILKPEISPLAVSP